MESESAGRAIVLVGLVLGIVFGALAIFRGPWPALLVLLCGAVGAALAWSVNGLLRGRFDVAGAWRTLTRKGE